MLTLSGSSLAQTFMPHLLAGAGTPARKELIALNHAPINFKDTFVAIRGCVMAVDCFKSQIGT